ncbi:hypothetical protein GpartN1_g2927.t1 [Galdieria partita]|uniref:Uncharacterized protein n=1 Tax=Galdieria partita TaxID=83374 RepID=A0A9C7PVF6_9RHOD|nr:hypothetical protein GpartN1_g2927.t1 [Galdieria partita]
MSSEDKWVLSISQHLLSAGFFPTNCVVSDSETNCKNLSKWLETTDSKLVLKELANWIASKWFLETDFLKQGKKGNLVEGLLTFYKYLNIRIPVSFLTGKSFQWAIYKSILDEVVGIMLTIRELSEEPCLTEQEQVLFPIALEGTFETNVNSDIRFLDGNYSESMEITSFQVQNEMRKVIDIITKYSCDSSENWMNFDEMKENINVLVEREQRENTLLDAYHSNQLERDTTVLWNLFSRLHQIMEEFQENRQQLEMLEKWKQNMPRLDSDLGKKVQKIVALLKPALDILQENQLCNQVCSEIIHDGRKLERMGSQMKLSESLLLRLEKYRNTAEDCFNGKDKENIDKLNEV